MLPQVASAVDADVHGAIALLEHVYSKHPPKKASMTVEAIHDLRAELHPKTALAKKKKALLKAQRDYHPDRNASGTLRWQELSLEISQQLADKSSSLFRPECELDGDMV